MKILYFYPENPLLFNQGNNARAYALLEYFKSRNYEVDFVAQQSHDEKIMSKRDIKELKNCKLINNGWLLNRSKHNGLKYFLYSIKTFIRHLFYTDFSDFNRLRYGQEIEFASIVNKNAYDYIIISYANFLPFIANKKIDIKNAITIVDTHDFLTAQYQKNKSFKLGAYFEEELRLLKGFNHVWAISNEEQFVFSQFLKSKVTLIPHTVNNNSNLVEELKTIDLFYVASDNEHNIESSKWFFNQVYPLLDSNIKIVAVGKIVHHIPDLFNVEKIEFVGCLKALYSKTKISICPMLSGTGLKIKVVEALSFGIPVVCNQRGVDGLLNKINNGCLVTNNNEEFAFHINKLLNDVNYFSLHSELAKTFFQAAFSKNKIYNELDAFFNNILD